MYKHESIFYQTYLYLDNPPFIIYNTLVTWFECDVKFDFSDCDIGLRKQVGFFP